MRISDPKAIRAMAHPLRLDLLEVLSGAGPATAARCGRILGVSQASCSFHLRQLAKFGFVEDAGPGRDKRERLWRIVDRRVHLATERGLDPLVVQQFSRVVVERDAQRILDYVERAPDEDEPWRTAATTTTGATLPLTAQDVEAIRQGWREVLEPYIAAALARGGVLHPGQRYVRIFQAAFPLPGIDEGTDDD
jgi:DNA-binding transcriptional ArsR family regulator